LNLSTAGFLTAGTILFFWGVATFFFAGTTLLFFAAGFDFFSVNLFFYRLLNSSWSLISWPSKQLVPIFDSCSLCLWLGDQLLLLLSTSFIFGKEETDGNLNDPVPFEGTFVCLCNYILN